MGYNPQESLENTINTMGTLLGVQPIVPWIRNTHKTYHKQPTPAMLHSMDLDAIDISYMSIQDASHQDLGSVISGV